MNRIKRIALLAIMSSMTMICSAAHAADAKDTFEVGALHVERYGDRGPAVILIPGLASGPWVWKDVIPALRREHRVYAVTLAGFDGRPAVKGDVLALANRSLDELIASEKIDKPVLVGHSLGGTLALMFAEDHSDRIAGVLAVDGLPVFPSTEGVPASQRAAMAERIRTQFAAGSQADFEASQLQYMRRIGTIDEERAAVLANLASRSDHAATADYAAAVMALDLRPRLSAIRVPVLEVSPYYANDFAGTAISEAAKAAYYRTLLAGVEKLDVISIPQARHFVMLDQPEAFMRVLDDFLHRIATR